MMEDKIFNNSYGNVEFDTGEIKFELDSSIYNEVYQDLNDELDMKMMYDALDEVIQDSEYIKYNEPDENGDIPKLSKEQINKVFLYVIGKLKRKYTVVDLFVIVSEYFDILPTKFYSALSNQTKNELIDELDKRYNIFNKKKYKKLF